MSNDESRRRLIAVRARLADQASWPDPATSDGLQFLYDGITLYGLTGDDDCVDSVKTYFLRVRAVQEPSVRAQVYRRVQDDVFRERVGLHALLPFLFIEEAGNIVAEAAIDYCMLYPVDSGSPLAGCRKIIGFMLDGRPANPGAILGGLVSLGDQRVVDALAMVKWLLTDADISEAMKTMTPFANVASIEFWVAWMEELVSAGIDQGNLFATAATAVARLAQLAERGGCREIERVFGYSVVRDSAGIVMHRHFAKAEMAQMLSSRLLAIEAAEEAPKLMSDVLVSWGLEPQAPLADRYVVQ